MSQHRFRTDDPSTTGALAAAMTEAMLTSDHALSVLDADSGRWMARPWREVHARAAQIATQLLADSAADGVEPRALGLIGDPTIDLIAAIQGAFLAGVAVSILPGPIRGADETRWAANTYARFIDIGVGTVLGTGDQFELLTRIPGPLRTDRADGYGLSVESTNTVVRQHNPSDDPVAVLQGTAGSTGEPKTAVLTAGGIHTNVVELAARGGIDPDRDVGFTWLPLYHDMGLMFLLAGMRTGTPLWVVPNSAFAAQPFKWLQWLSQTRATITAAPNFAYDIVGRYGRLLADVDLSALRFAISGGEPIDPDGFDRFLAETARLGFDPAAAAPAYGMAESGCAVTVPEAGEGVRYDEVVVIPADGGQPLRRRYALLGKPLDGMEIRITAADGAVPAIEGRSVGQVEIRGTSMMQGYLGRAPLRAGEWFSTGDLGYLVDGRLVICGRAKEIVIVAGRNLFPVEVERAAAAVPGVRRGGVVALARGESTARPGLVVVAEYRGSQAEVARSEIIAEVASACGVVPAEVLFVDPGAVPRTTSGKIRRLATKDLVERGVWA